LLLVVTHDDSNSPTRNKNHQCCKGAEKGAVVDICFRCVASGATGDAAAFSQLLLVTVSPLYGIRKRSVPSFQRAAISSTPMEYILSLLLLCDVIATLLSITNHSA
jgi:hypothetical protein